MNYTNKDFTFYTVNLPVNSDNKKKFDPGLLSSRWYCDWCIELTLNLVVPCYSKCDTLKNPDCPIVVISKHTSIDAFHFTW